VEVITTCSNPRVNRQFEVLLHLYLDLSDRSATELLDDRQPVIHAPTGRRHYLPPADVDAVIQCYQAGSTIREIGTTFGVGRETVSSILKSHDVRIRNQSLEPEAVALAIDLYRSGLSLAKVGNELHCDASTVRLALEGSGVPRRDTHGGVRTFEPRK
jgi:transposase-like protein